MLFNSKTHAMEAGEYALIGGVILVVAALAFGDVGKAIAAKAAAIASAIGK